MAITLLRRQSDVPTVQGQDDSRMMRYAVVHDGVTRGYQSECGYRISGSTFTVLGGEIIVDGWQAIIDSLGCAVQAISSSTKMYYIVYVEYDLRTPDQQSVTIKSTYTSGTFPEITPGDDLTENPNGLRRFALYRFTIQNGTISDVERLFSYCEVGDSKNVTTSINGKAITSIFENDGTTVKRATTAATARKMEYPSYSHQIVITGRNGANVFRVGLVLIDRRSSPYRQLLDFYSALNPWTEAKIAASGYCNGSAVWAVQFVHNYDTGEQTMNVMYSDSLSQEIKQSHIVTFEDKMFDV